jgi:hypothetical protein
MSLDLILSLVLLAFISVGVIGFTIGKKRNSNITITFGAALVVLSFLVYFELFPNLAVNISALATVAVAILAGVTIVENSRLNDAMRKDNREKEKREMIEKFLGEIKVWAKNLENKQLDLNKERIEIKNRSKLENSDVLFNQSEIFFSEFGNCAYFQKSLQNINDLNPKILVNVTTIELQIKNIYLKLLFLGHNFKSLNEFNGKPEEVTYLIRIAEMNILLGNILGELSISLIDLQTEVSKSVTDQFV